MDEHITSEPTVCSSRPTEGKFRDNPNPLFPYTITA